MHQSSFPSSIPQFSTQNQDLVVSSSQKSGTDDFQVIILLLKRKLLFLTVYICQGWGIYNYMKAELVNDLSVQRVPQSGSLPHRIAVCHGQIQKPCWVKAQ